MDRSGFGSRAHEDVGPRRDVFFDCRPARNFLGYVVAVIGAHRMEGAVGKARTGLSTLFDIR